MNSPGAGDEEGAPSAASVLHGSDNFDGSLSSRKCELCTARGGAPTALSEHTVGILMQKICPLWKPTDNNTAIVRTFVCRNFLKALEWVNKAGKIAETEQHHPDLSIWDYRKVIVLVLPNNRPWVFGYPTLKDIYYYSWLQKI